MKYKCIKTFSIKLEDDDKSGTDAQRTIPEGSVWSRLEGASAWLPDGMVSLNREYTLNGQKVKQWIEIGTKRLAECFERMGGE